VGQVWALPGGTGRGRRQVRVWHACRARRMEGGSETTGLSHGGGGKALVVPMEEVVSCSEVPRE